MNVLNALLPFLTFLLGFSLGYLLCMTNRIIKRCDERIANLQEQPPQTDIRYCPHCEEDTQQEVQEYDDVSRDYQRCLTCDATYREIGGWTHADSGASQ